MNERIRVALLALSATLAVFAPAHAADEPPKGDAKRGRQIFVDDGCFQCHGRYGQGGRGATLLPLRMPYEAYRFFVRQSSGSMPPYSEAVFSEQAVADTYAYLKSLQEPLPVDQLPAILKP